MAEEAEATREADERNQLHDYRCSANEKCLHGGNLQDTTGVGMYGQHDGYGIYAGKWHDDCWDRFGYKDFVFDPGYAGESLEEDY
jgi:hypothetical protein